MVESRISLELASIDHDHRLQDPRARSHRLSDTKISTNQTTRCKSLEKHLFQHDHFTHSKIVRASHDIPHYAANEHEHKHNYEDHSRTVIIKKRVVSENFLLDSFPS